MARPKEAGLGDADSFKLLRELSIERMSFFCDIALPHTLESIIFRHVYFRGAVRLDECRCAMMPQQGSRVLGRSQTVSILRYSSVTTLL